MSLITPPGPAKSSKPTHSTGSSLLDAYRAVRAQTERLGEPLEPEDFVVQSMPDASPVKWHFAHTSWFFETFILSAALSDYHPRFPQYNFLFNSYYNSIGERIARDRRGLLSRPTIAEVRAYRREIDEQMEGWLGTVEVDAPLALEPIVVLGLHHEQQHQELIVTDLKHAFAGNPLRPIYRERNPTSRSITRPIGWITYPGGVHQIGHQGTGFAFDNESPSHRQYLEPFELASRPSTNGEYLSFIADGGYDRPEFWLSDGWAARKSRGWSAPLYWDRADGPWMTMSLAGFLEVELDEPVTHLSFYEADAFARWSGARLATEAEWEVAANGLPIDGNFLESGRYHPAPATGPRGDEQPLQMFGDVWEWTRSPYTPYPGYQPAAGALGEYNGKFMCNQMVLRGGSCATPRTHMRACYRNFFPPEARWQFSGVRLARDVPR
ncbi:ergothioneine biosynthesis protein EgtB [Tundrisphaera lichenicola]|uniref:ergothioneine biosynthesis protein EgtB n=1 Tax=Tundrisphaera lichenicola TaxID=2029860 RepID=UPI003EBF84CC